MELINQQIEKIIDKNIDLELIIFLKLCEENNKEYIEKFNKNDDSSKSMYALSQGLITTSENITEKGKKLLNELGMLCTKIDTSNKWHELHKELQSHLLKVTGSKQVKANGGYSFLCNEIDLHNKLSKAIVKYKLNDWEKIKKLLLLHINKSYKQRFDKVFLIQYYIEKNGMSTLASDYFNFDEKEVKKEEIIQNNSNFDGVNI